ncbi:MAG TPA: transcriptional regulator [Syntrophorhabdus aromaticivorans]|nr:transcriptional regulator [Syntrophorhabdus aromaticivorans]
MPVVINLDIMMAKRKIGLLQLADKIGLSPTNLSLLKNNHGKAIRFSTLEAICEALDCQPGDILEYVKKDD